MSLSFFFLLKRFCRRLNEAFQWHKPGKRARNAPLCICAGFAKSLRGHLVAATAPNKAQCTTHNNNKKNTLKSLLFKHESKSRLLSNTTHTYPDEDAPRNLFAQYVWNLYMAEGTHTYTKHQTPISIYFKLLIGPYHLNQFLLHWLGNSAYIYIIEHQSRRYGAQCLVLYPKMFSGFGRWFFFLSMLYAPFTRSYVRRIG